MLKFHTRSISYCDTVQYMFKISFLTCTQMSPRRIKQLLYSDVIGRRDVTVRGWLAQSAVSQFNGATTQRPFRDYPSTQWAYAHKDGQAE